MNTTQLIRNPGLHMTKQGLTDRSKAMTGDREDAA